MAELRKKTLKRAAKLEADCGFDTEEVASEDEEKNLQGYSVFRPQGLSYALTEDEF